MTNTYSFQNINGSIAGPGGFVNLANGSAAAEEGITIEMSEDKNTMLIGADGAGQNTLNAGDSCHATCRFLKTSPANAKLQLMYNLQKTSAALWGTNVITFTDSARGDFVSLTGVSFKKQPTIVYDKAGPMLEWAFDAITNNTILGGL